MFCCFPGDGPDITNRQTDKLLRVLTVLCIVQVCLGIFIMFIDIWSGIMLLLGSLILVIVIWAKNWCVCIVYIILCLMDILTSVMIIGNYFAQNDVTDGNEGILIVLFMIKFPFYLLVVYYTFLAYRELKGLFIENISQLGHENYGAVQNWYDNRRQSSPPPPPPPQPFTGTGYRLDG